VGFFLWWEVGSVIYNCYWPSPAQSFSGPSSVGLVTIFYCLGFETSLLVAFFDSQGYGGGIRNWMKRNFGGELCTMQSECGPCLHSSWHFCKFLQCPYTTPAATFANIERRVNLCLQAKGKQFQRLPWSNYLHIYRGAYSQSFVFIVKLLLYL
jgi:hypothetical protein